MTLMLLVEASQCRQSPLQSPKRILGRDRQIVLSKQSAASMLLASPASSDRQSLALLRIRGGATKELDLESNGDGFILSKLRNLIRSLLNMAERQSSTLSQVFKTFFAAMEQASGVRLLPVKKKAKKSKKATKMSKKKTDTTKAKSKPSKTTTTKAIDTKTKKTKVAVSLKPKHVQSKPKPSSSSKKIATATSAMGASAKAKVHLDKPLKSNSPNYRIQRELKAFIQEPPDNLMVKVGKNMRVWIVTMKGATGTVYEGETFLLRIAFPAAYPTVPPSVYFLPPNIPIHEHVYTNGDICLSLLGKDWRPTMTAQSIAVSILSILSSAQSKSLPMDNARQALNKPGEYQKDWVYHDE